MEIIRHFRRDVEEGIIVQEADNGTQVGGIPDFRLIQRNMLRSSQPDAGKMAELLRIPVDARPAFRLSAVSKGSARIRLVRPFAGL